jgi:predicted AlkP superfamily phosphohydrolase/phosphomutase
MDEKHPAYDRVMAGKFGGTIERTYRQADEILAQSLAKVDKDTVVLVMSDHGFRPFYRGFNLNTWLRDSGYHRLINEFKKEEMEMGFPSTDWSKTRAYGIGLNGLYINERGRESAGIVAAGGEKDALVREIAAKLEAYRDPQTGDPVVQKAYVAKDIYSGPHVDEAPDLVVGFAPGYRISWKSPQGCIPARVMETNTAKWSGDHMGAAENLPGIVLTNEPLQAEAPALYDVTATLMDVFGVEKPRDYIGTSIFRREK